MHFYFLVEVLLLTTSVLKQREVPATVSSLYVSVFNTAMLRTSIAAVVLGCFYFRPLDCDIAFMVVDYAAVETGCTLEKYVTSPLLLLSFASVAVAAVEKGYAFLFSDRGAAAYNISSEAERGTGYCFLLLRFCPLHCDASDVYCCCCSWLLLFLSFRLRYLGHGC